MNIKVRELEYPLVSRLSTQRLQNHCILTKELVVEYAEDLAAGGRFKKPSAAELGEKEA